VAHDETAGGRDPERVWYANVFDVGQNAYEFKVDCGRDGEGEEEAARVWLRVIASPANARQLFRLLGTSLLEYADRFGPIDDDQGHGPVKDES
jgi:hypothetical protein